MLIYKRNVENIKKKKIVHVTNFLFISYVIQKNEHLFCCGVLKWCYSSFWIFKLLYLQLGLVGGNIFRHSGGHKRSSHCVDQQDWSMSCRKECGFAVTPVAQPKTIDRLLVWTSIETIHSSLRRTKRNAFRVLKDSKLNVLTQ